MYNDYNKLISDDFKSVIRSNFIITSKGTTHYLETGQEHLPVLLVIHGSNSCASIALSYAQDLYKTYRIIALDIPGEPGKSEFIRLSKNNTGVSQWLKECIDILKLQEVTVIGYSLGAYITLKTAINNPSVFKHIIIISPAGVVNGSIYNGVFKVLIPLLGYKVFKKETLLKRLYNSLNTKHNPKEYEYFKWITDYFKSDYSATPLIDLRELQGLEITATVILGKEDIIFDFNKLYRRLIQTLPNAQIHQLNNEKHVMDVHRISQLLSNLL